MDIIGSPCVTVCMLDRELGLCMGCLRTLAEIGGWRTMDMEHKKAVVAACEERAKTIPRRGKDGKPLPPRP